MNAEELDRLHSVLFKRVEELEKRLAELEQRPQVPSGFVPFPYPGYPFWPTHPATPPTYWVTYSSAKGCPDHA